MLFQVKSARNFWFISTHLTPDETPSDLGQPQFHIQLEGSLDDVNIDTMLATLISIECQSMAPMLLIVLIY